MGQTGSAQLETLPLHVEAHPLPVKKIPPPRPSSPPKRPRSPTKNHPKYAVPENKVLPIGDLQKRRLRPVSQEISKVYPEFTDLFPKYESDDDLDNDEEESMDVTEKSETVNHTEDSNVIDGITEKPITNTENNTAIPVKHQNGITSNGTVPKFNRSLSVTPDVKYLEPQEESHLKRTHSLDRAPMRLKGHRRQVSVTTSLMNEQNTIFEDPRESLGETREHLYDQWRKDPYTNATPSVVSLPVKSNFDIDVTYNMTYAQLAEHRRQKHLEDLQKKTGINVGQLHTDLAEKSTVQYNPFQRQYSRESTRSTSTTSSEAHGVSKRKKKRAPPPPGTKAEESTQSNEPPADYDIDELPQIDVKQNWRRSSIASTTSNLSTKSKLAPPPPSVVVPKPASLPEYPEESLTTSNSTTDSPASSQHHPNSPSLPVDPSEQSAQESPSLQQESLISASQKISSVSKDGQSSVVSSIKTEKAEQEQLAIEKLEKLLSSEEESKPADAEESESECNEEKENIQTIPEKSPEKRLNSLVLGKSETTDDDPDRVRILKPKIPPIVTEKPKDANDIFREQLAKAYEDRAKRREEELKKKEEQAKLLEAKRRQEEEEEEERNMSARSEKKHGESVEILRRLSQDLDKKWLSNHISHTVDEAAAPDETDDDLSVKDGKSQGHRRVFSEDWTPEHDLDSDDDIEDRHSVYSHQRSTSEGFKSSIIPNKINEGKKNSKGKYIRKQADITDERQKYGSIRKLKKTVNKSVRNAFGSLSRASGKLLRKQKSVDIDIDDGPPVPPVPSNWQLSASTHRLNGDARLMERRRSESDLLSSDNDSDESADELQTGVTSTLPDMGKKKMNGHAHGFTNSLPREYRNVEQPEDTSSRLFKKKKKKNGYLLTANPDRDPMESLMTEQIKEKERQIGMEKQKQLEIEKELLRLRALEQEERFQRLQTAHFQQQLQILQQSVSGTSTISAPPLPPAGGIRGYSVQDYPTPSNTYPHVLGQTHPQSPVSPGLNMPFNHGNNGQSMPNLTSIDINYLSNLMRMNGVQPPATSQQWAYLLNSVSIPQNHRQAKSMYSIPTVPSQSHHVKSMYVTTSGPDLSRLFTRQTMDDGDLPNPKHSMIDILAGNRHSQNFTSLGEQTANQIPLNSLLHDYERSTSGHAPAKVERVKQRSNPVYHSSDEDLSSGLSPARTSRNYTASSYVTDYRPLPNGQQLEADMLMSGSDLHSQMYAGGYHVPTSPDQRQRLPEEDSSSGADR